MSDPPTTLQPPAKVALWRNPDFARLWIGQTISEFGSMLGALSLLAILTLEATPAQMGLLETLRIAPTMLLGLFAGVWVDRLRRRPILIAADLGRALILALVVLTAFLGRLEITFLYIAAFLVGALTIFFDTAYHAYVPVLVRRERLVEANSKLGTTASLAEIASPGLGGVLVELITAPLTLFLDAISFLLSAVVIATIRTPEAAVEQDEEPAPIRQDILRGLGIIIQHPLLRTTAAAWAMRNFFGGFFAALYSLFVLREIGLTPALLGILVGSGGVGALFGAVISARLINRFGLGRSIVVAGFFSGLLALLIPLAGGPPLVAFAILLAGQLFGDAFLAVYMIAQLSLRQSVTPDRLLGRVNASFEFLVGAIGTFGIMTGGLVGQWLGLRPASAVASIGILLSTLILFFSPLRHMHDPAEWEVQ